MGAKSASSSGAKSINKVTMVMAVTSMQLQSSKINNKRAQFANLKRQLMTDPDCLSGDRAVSYQESFEELDAFAEKVAASTELLRKAAQEKNAELSLNIDFRKVDAKAQASVDALKSTRAKKLKGK